MGRIYLLDCRSLWVESVIIRHDQEIWVSQVAWSTVSQTWGLDSRELMAMIFRRIWGHTKT